MKTRQVISQLLGENMDGDRAEALRDHFPIPAPVRKAMSAARASLYGDATDEDTPGFESALGTIREWADDNVFDVYYAADWGGVTDSMTETEDEPDAWSFVDRKIALRSLFGEIASYL